MSALAAHQRARFAEPFDARLRTLAGISRLTFRVVRLAFRRPITYQPELIAEFAGAARVCLLPLVLTSFALSFGPAGVQASNVLSLFGAIDRLGGVYVIVVIREFGPLVTAIVVAGAAGTAMCADLGARNVRQETEALQVLSVDPVRSLVVPRMIAIVVLCMLLNIFSIFAGMLGALLVVSQHHADLAPFFETFFSSATLLELAASFAKAGIYGAMIALVCCYKGMNVSGGADAVGRAVNEAVVITFLMIGVLDYGVTQFLLATNPVLSQVR